MTPISARVITRASARLLSIETLRQHCEVVTTDVDSDGVESSPDDANLQRYQDAAVGYVERFTGRSILIRTYETALSDFPSASASLLLPASERLPIGIELPYPPLIEVQSFTYTDDSDGELEPDVDYTVDTYGDKAVLRPVTAWPSVLTPAWNRVKIRYVAGYSGEVEPDSDAEPVPGEIVSAVLLLVEFQRANRGEMPDEIPPGIEALLRPLRVLVGMA